ncbi:MAG: UDP-N-acetylglucosamine--N-acetylmuramyl-(pentapeptide) pyrophosphoryl-undecaprenol N-acetylglucosamine transferase [Verrucomicrobia bacterium]|nr:UDP-N-acetylglucosamine--N-acetylmuramyl-(pentapeptide) pyrophosphoryl-undecaprenol N-acetylglucosamine transferase [Verrucomicrobiota bacterium]MBS0636547.1 UDP-N-acetylglucosamine--N-acetylmuramyl-(pentapeptide) pyrophosphoryl-undecaprenol N-acetylglucosamine transferase [Verrucomicrobiota bacterium]
MRKRIVISAGGTGGHLFPAQNLAKELSDAEIVFMAKGLATNSRFNKSHNYTDISSGPIALKSIYYICKGVIESTKALRAFKPDLVIGFGSYHSFPVLVAAKLLGIPIVLHEANSVPGKVNRLFSPFARVTGIFFPDSAKHLRGNIQRTDIPLKAEFQHENRPTKEDARRHYGLDEHVTTILVFGGSLGAKKLNELASASISKLSRPIQVIHFTGGPTEAIKAQYNDANISSFVAEFEPNMQYAWAASDVVLSRSGASTVAEAITFAVPALFVPYPFATDAHQDKNADYVTREIGGAVWHKEKDLEEEMLTQALDALLASQQHTKMKEALILAANTMQTKRFSDLVREVLE